MANDGVTPDTGEQARSGMVPAFGDVGFALKVGEIGIKGEFLDRTLRVNLDGYYGRHVNVQVTNTDGNFTNPVQFTLTPLAITGLNVTTGSSAGATAVVISGTSFAGGATVTFDAIAAVVTARNGTTQITITTPARPHGSATVDVSGKYLREPRVIVKSLAARLRGVDGECGGIQIALRTNAGRFDEGAILRGFFGRGQLVQRAGTPQVPQVNVEIAGSVRKQARGLRRSCSPQQPAKRRGSGGQKQHDQQRQSPAQVHLPDSIVGELTG